MKKREIRKPDVKAPRFRITRTSLIDEAHLKEFIKLHPKYKDLTLTQYRKIVSDFNTLFWQTVVETPDGCQLPEGLGYIFVAACDPVNEETENIDYSKSFKYGTTLSNNNWVTNGYLAKIFYTNNAEKYKFRNREFWGFKACRNFKRGVSKNFLENWQMYYRVHKDKKINSIYKKRRILDIREKNLTNKTNTFEL
jgi:hypothetical protein